MKVDFEIGDALQKLERARIVEVADGRYRAIPIEAAQERLDTLWDRYATRGGAAARPARRTGRDDSEPPPAVSRQAAPEGGQRVALDLADPLTGQPHRRADLLERRRHRPSSPNRSFSTVASRSPSRSSAPRAARRSSAAATPASGVAPPAVRREAAQVHVVAPDPPGREHLVGLVDRPGLLRRQPEAAGHLLLLRLAAEFLAQLGLDPPPLVQPHPHVLRQPEDVPGLVQGDADRLLDPVHGVGAEPRPRVRVVALDRPHQAQVSLGDQVFERQPLAGVLAGDADHQPEVGAGEVVAGLDVAAGDPAGQVAPRSPR